MYAPLRSTSADRAANPRTMRAWLYNSTAGGLEKNLYLDKDARVPPTDLGKDEVLIRVLAMSVNPVDYKLAEMPLVGSATIGYPASPGMDFSGTVLALGAAVDSFAIGDAVFGKLDKPCKFGPLGELMIVRSGAIVTKPDEISHEHAATIGVCGLTAYQSIVPFTKAGQRVFINGGSGGTGTFGIQIAKAHGLEVTVSCSTPNVQFCKDLGADQVIDYKTQPLSGTLITSGQVYDLIVDNVGNPPELYHSSHLYLKATGRYVQIGGETSQTTTILRRALQPSFLGGGKRPWQFLSAKTSQSDWRQVAKWMAEGKVKAVIQQVYEFGDAPDAYDALKTGRTRGKLVVKVGRGSPKDDITI